MHRDRTSDIVLLIGRLTLTGSIRAALLLSLLGATVSSAPAQTATGSDFTVSTVVITEASDVVPPNESGTTLDYQFGEAIRAVSFFSGVRLSVVGNRAAISDVLILLHGDKPSFYDAAARNGKKPSIEDELTQLDGGFAETNAGLLVVQPLCSAHDWHSLYRSSRDDERARFLALEIAELCTGLTEKLGGVKRLHLHSFSGAGRVDRAIHEAMLSEEEAFGLLRKRLDTWTVSDAMVNNAYSLSDKQQYGSVMAVSWARFLHRFRSIRTHFIYDRSGQYHYMQGITLDVFRFLEDLRDGGEIVSPPSVRLARSGGGPTVLKNPANVAAELQKLEQREGLITVSSEKDHMATFLGCIAKSYFQNSQ